MAIEFNRQPGALNTTNARTQTAKTMQDAGTYSPSASTTANKPNTTDQVQISQNAQNLQSLTEDLKVQPEINQQKVQQLKLAIDSGTYKVDSTLVANKLLDFEANL